MNRNQESRFSQIPQININRSIFDRPHRHITSFNAGKLIPIYVDEMLPGDTFKMRTSWFVRMSTPIFPVMDNAYLDYYYFFVPNRLLWDHWREFMGENTTAPWTQTTEYKIPQVVIPPANIKPYPEFQPGSVADYMGLPTLTGDATAGQAGFSVSALPFRAYVLIWNEWFRSENYQYPAYFTKNDTNRTPDVIGENQLPIDGGQLLPVDRFHDYFSSALPEPQKGDPVSISLTGSAPLTTGTDYQFSSNEQLHLMTPNATPAEAEGLLYYQKINTPNPASNNGIFVKHEDTDMALTDVIAPITGSNLYADMQNTATITINQLRQAFQIQRLLELDARGGTRYISLLKAHFGVTSPDSRLQRPEYLGGTRFNINMQQVLQTSSTDNTSPQGNTAAFSATTHVEDNDFTYSATEHGWIIGVACIRTDHTYQQGINKMWSRSGRYDFYWPALANLGEQAILNKEIYAYFGRDEKERMEEPFGYQEAWAEYRYKPSIISGDMRTNSPNGTLDSWHYGDYYENVPTLSQKWLEEPLQNIDRTLAVQSSVSHQFIADIAFDLQCTRPMPVYSIPGLIDHM